MKKYILLQLGCLLIVSMVHNTISAYTSYMQPRTIITQPHYYESAIPYNVFKSPVQDFSISAGVMYQRSLGGKKLSSKFSLNDRDTIVLDQTGRGDISPFWIDLVGPKGNHAYKSKVKLDYYQHTVGVPFLLRNSFKNYFLEVTTALVSRKSNMKLSETERTTSGVIASLNQNKIITNAKDAFSNPAWKYGHLAGSSSSRGLDNIFIRLGKNIENEKTHSNITVQPYVISQLPTGSKEDAKYVLSSRVGTRTYAFGLGLTTLFESKKQNKSLSIDMQYRYETASLEKRSFDLKKGGKFSRYMSVSYNRQPNFVYPGINFFTKDAYIKQGHQASINFQYEYESRYATIFANYNLFAKQHEEVLWVEDIEDNISIHDFSRVASPPSGGVPAAGGAGTPTSMSKANISQSIPDMHTGTGPTPSILASYTNPAPVDPTFTALKTSDLDVESAISPSYMSSTIAAGLHKYHNDYFMQFGAHLEIPHLGERSGFLQGGIWMRLVKII